MQWLRIVFALVSLALPLTFDPGQAPQILSILTVDIGEASSTELPIDDAPEQPPVIRTPQRDNPPHQSRTADGRRADAGQ